MPAVDGRPSGHSARRRGGRAAGYGLPIGRRFVGTPRAGIRTSEYGRDYRLGYSTGVLQASELKLQIGIEAEQREIPTLLLQAGGAARDQRVLGRAAVEW